MGRLIDVDKLNEYMEKRYKKANYDKDMIREAEIVKAVLESFAPTVVYYDSTYENLIMKIMQVLNKHDINALEKIDEITVVINKSDIELKDMVSRERVIEIISNSFANLDNFESKTLLINRIENLPTVL
jgi:hypothetical protein